MRSPASILISFLLLAPTVRAAESGALWQGGVQALLDENCVKCHGPLKQKSGLVLDTVEGALKGGEDGAVITPGAPEKSPLMAALVADADPHMPPKKQLAPEEIARVREWIASLGQAAAARPAAEPIVFNGTEPAVAIDFFLERGWRDRGVVPTPQCDDATFVRRIYLDLAGRIPKPEEVESFVSEAAPDKRERLVERLLAGDEYPRNFREIWDALLMGRASGHREQRRQENGWFTFLETAFRENRPWNEVVRALIEARPVKPEDRGALWFVYERRDNYQEIAEALAPLIYGTRVSCAQCHDHPLAREIKQGHYWGLVSAFNRSKNLEKGGPAVSESAVGGFINFTNIQKETQAATIMLLNGRKIEEARPAADAKPSDPPEGYLDPAAEVKVPKFSRRAALAEAATVDNPLLARAFVNYTWAILMGRGIVQPVDEINSKHPASHPELLEWLAKDFAAHGYDIKRLVRSIVATRGYQLAPATEEPAPAPEAFAAAAEKPLTGEAIARSLEIVGGSSQAEAALRPAVTAAFSDVLPRVPRASIQQAMFLENNDRLAGLFKAGASSAAARLAEIAAPEERVRQAFRLALIRLPDAEELAEGVQFLAARGDRAADAAGDLLWALVTGPEFLTNH